MDAARFGNGAPERRSVISRLALGIVRVAMIHDPQGCANLTFVRWCAYHLSGISRIDTTRASSRGGDASATLQLCGRTSLPSRVVMPSIDAMVFVVDDD